jgi:hypothetical protein
MKKLTKYIILITVFVFKYDILLCQKQTFDTANVILNAKMSFVRFDMSNINRDEIIKIIDSEVKYKVLDSKGFDSCIVFFQIIAEPLENSDSNNYFFSLINQYNSYFVIAYNSINLSIYKLKGFNENDFKIFFFHLNSYLDLNVTGSDDLTTKKKIINTFYIEGVDLACLYKSLKVRKKNNCGCLQPNSPIFNSVEW